MILTTLRDSGPPLFLFDPRRACKDWPDPNQFFPEGHGRGRHAGAIRNICARCPLLDDCLDYALPIVNLAGVWGGTTELERKTYRQLVAAGKSAPRPGPQSTTARALRVEAAGEQVLAPHAGKRLSPDERETLAIQLTAAGWSAVRIARRLGVTPRTVQLYRRRAREAA